jgi:hypothetical protein
MAKLPADCVTPSPLTWGSGGMAKLAKVDGSQPLTPRHGFAFLTVRSKPVM